MTLVVLHVALCEICTLCDQLGQRAWKSAVLLSEVAPARAFICGNSKGSRRFQNE
jgi:hypothetical protein